MVGTLFKRRGGEWGKRIRSEKLREHQYREGYARYLDSRRVEWYEWSNIEQVFETSNAWQCKREERCVAQWRGGERTQRRYGGIMW